MNHTRVLSVGLLLVLTACSAEDPEKLSLDFGGGQDSLPLQPDGPLTCESEDLVAAPALDPGNPAVQTPQLRVPLRGSAPGAQTMVAKGASGIARPVSVSSDGRFCIDVDLLPDIDNRITLIPYSGLGCPGETMQISVRHVASTQPDAGPTAEVQNVARDAVVTTGGEAHSIKVGSKELLVDGDSSSYARFSMTDWDINGACDAFIWVKLDLGKVYTVTRALLRWAATAVEDRTYATGYAVLLSSKENPVDPSTSHADWVTVKSEIEGGAEDPTLVFSPERARWVAVLLYEDAATRLIPPPQEIFELAEIEIMGQDPDAVPEAPMDSCK
ncbi:MAG: discoidin domain-containing protein [Deltaproteobacteria bacterium]|nr:discoidin domain-containing protein [Deltaproteobacteria bacterium]